MGTAAPSDHRATTALPFVSGAIVGAGAAVVSFVATAFLAMEDGPISPSAGVNFGDVEASYVDVLLWLFFEAHFVEIERTGTTGTEHVVLFGGGGVPEFVYTLVPAFFLVVAGAMLVDHHGGEADTDALVGGLVALGYLPVMVGLRFVATTSGGGVTIAPALLSTVVVAGVAFPVVCGVLGGYIELLGTNREG